MTATYAQPKQEAPMQNPDPQVCQPGEEAVVTRQPVSDPRFCPWGLDGND